MKNLLKNINGLNHDWEIVNIKIDEIQDTATIDWKHEFGNLNKPRNRKLIVYRELYKSGTVFPPITLDEGNKVMDGTHRLMLYKYLEKKIIKVLRRTGKGTGKVKGKFPGKSTFPYKNLDQEHPTECIVCNTILNYLPKAAGASPMDEFPQGLPTGPLWYCKPCGVVVKKGFIVWN